MRIEYEEHKIRSKTSYIFWNHCAKCKAKVKREPMWERYTYSPYDGMSIYDYYCKECFPTKESLKELINRKPEPPKER